MPAANVAEFNAAVATLAADAAIQHAIIHGAVDDPDVETESGPVPPIAKRLGQIGFETFDSVLVDADDNLVIVKDGRTIRFAGVFVP